MSDLYNSGVRKSIDDYLLMKSKEVRDYGDYWSASSAGYCMRLLIMRRLGVAKVPELEDNATQTRIFEAGHIFHEWLQRITKDAGLSIASEVELQDEKLMIRGHFDDLVLVGDGANPNLTWDDIAIIYKERTGGSAKIRPMDDIFDWATGQPDIEETDDGSLRLKGNSPDHLILYDYKTAHSASFNFKKRQTEIGHYHKYQLATYMYMIKKQPTNIIRFDDYPKDILKNLSEARILSISKDDLRMHEVQLLWTPKLEKEVYEYWSTLNSYWKAKTLPKCTCLDHDGGFMGRRSAKGKVYNDFFYNDEPCSLVWLNKWRKSNEQK